MFLVNSSTGIKEAKNGSHYVGLTLRDRTGDVACKFWGCDPNRPSDYPKPGDVVKVRGEVTEFNEKPQIEVRLNKSGKFRVLAPGEYDLADFIPASKHDRDALLRNIRLAINTISDPDIQATVHAMIESRPEQIKNAPAAEGMHQAYLGGLAEHMLRLVQLADAVATEYPGQLNRDLLVAAALIHDIGKTEELSYTTSIGYTRRGRLVGHITIGLQLFAKCRRDSDYPEPLEVLDHLEHIIISHHGRKDWGSPVEPMSREAQVFHLLDMIDSRMAAFDAIEGKEVLEANGITQRAVAVTSGRAYFPGSRSAPEPQEPTLLS